MTTLDTLGSGDPSNPRRCTAHSSRTGAPCKKFAINGSNVCGTHGGKAPQVVAKAKRRLEEAADRMAERLIGLAENTLADGTKVGAYVQLGAVTAALDRAGVVEPKDVTVTVKPFDQIFESIESGSRSEYRRANGIPDPVPQSPAIEDREPHRPGGALALGPGYVIDGEVVDTEAHDDQDGLEDASVDDDRLEAHRRATEALANRSLPLPPADGYLPSDIAMERVADANRAHRAQLRRR